MKLRLSALALVLAAGCGTSGEEIIAPLVGPDTTNLRFTQEDYLGNQLDFTLDVRTNTLVGDRYVVQADELTVCRHRVSTAVSVADRAALLGAVANSQLSTLTGGRCEDAQERCGGIDTSLGVSVDGGARYTTMESMCETLLDDAALQPSLDETFDSLEAVVERVEWQNGAYVAVGPCVVE
jgi:hypothetical protein